MRELSRRTFLGASASVLLLSACGGNGSGAAPAPAAATDKKPLTDLVAAAKGEGTLTIYHSTALEEEQAWAKQFSAKYGIDVVYYRATTGAIFERWTKESQADKNSVDVVAVNDPFLINAATDLGLAANYTPEDDPNFDPKLVRSGYFYPLQLIYEGIAWNTKNTTPSEVELLTTKGWDALTDPRWNGRYTTSSPVGGGTNQIWWWYPMRAVPDRLGTQYAQQMAAHKPAIFESKVPLFDRLAAGEYSICDIATETVAGSKLLAGAPIQWMYPDPTPVAITHQAVAEKAPHPNAARLFQEWACSPEGQEAWHTVNQATPANKNARDLRTIKSEPWYVPPKNLYIDWIDDKRFNDEDARNEMYREWQGLFGQQTIS